MSVVALDQNQMNTGLKSPYKLAAAQFTYSVPGAGSTWETTAGNYTTDMTPGANRQPFDAAYSTLNGTQAAQFIASIGAWDELIANNFSSAPADDASGHGEVRAAFTSDQMDSSTAAYAFQGSNQTPTSIVGDIWINSTSSGSTFAYGSFDYQTLLHEMGHVLGLKHSFDSPVIPSPYENTRYTIMSYTAGSTSYSFYTDAMGGHAVSTGTTVATPMVLDIAVVQDLYGVDTTTRSGNTTYTYTESNTYYLQTIYDAGGTDTIDLSAITRPNIVDMRPGGYSSIAVYSRAEQSVYWQGVIGAGYAAFIDAVLSDPNAYTWNDNLGIAFSTTIENVIGGSGNDTITGNDAANLMYLQLGGNDTVDGGLGDDGFYFGGAFTAADVVVGGGGTNDQIGLQGNYSGGLTLGASSITGVEGLVLLPGNDTRFGDTSGSTYSYNLTLNDANIAAGETLKVNWNTLRAGENVTLNASAETNGSLLTFGGAGTDNVTGGSQSDGFYFGNGALFGASDVVNGGAGTDDQLGLQGSYTITFGSGQLLSIETIVCMTGGDLRFGNPAGVGYSYSLTMNDANVANGATMTINANTLATAGGSLLADETLTFNGALETDGRFVVYGGAGADAITGGAGNDTIYGGAGADTLAGGLGNDTFAYMAASHSVGAGTDTITDFASGDKIDVSAIDAIAGGGDDAFSFIGSAAFSAAGQLRVVNTGGLNWQAQADIDGDGTADLVINFTNVDAHPITSADFNL